MTSPSPKTLFHHAYALDTYSQKALLKPNALLTNALTNSKTNSLPDIAISALQGQFLALQCRLINAKHVLEVGTLGGYSTLWFASTGAHVTSIEIDAKHRDVALTNTRDQGVTNVEVLLGAALDVMPKLAEEGKVFDFCFLDASWDEQYAYFDWAVKMTRSGGCVYVDNVVRELLESEVLDGDEESLLTKVGRDERVDATLVPTVGAHKPAGEMFDGFLLAVVK